jgi:hypothetical protein
MNAYDNMRTSMYGTRNRSGYDTMRTSMYGTRDRSGYYNIIGQNPVNQQRNVVMPVVNKILPEQSLVYGELPEDMKNKNKECPICYEIFKDEIKIFISDCLHIFCYGCIDTWLKENQKSCPLCRQTINI